jgi:hypothetical protein
MANPIIVKNEIIDAFFAVFLRSFSVNVEVIVKKIGIVPNGFISVKKEVNANNPKLI